MDFGSDRSISTLNKQIEHLNAKLNSYNTALAQIDVAKL
jgi:prefoldin subunit 5